MSVSNCQPRKISWFNRKLIKWDLIDWKPQTEVTYELENMHDLQTVFDLGDEEDDVDEEGSEQGATKGKDKDDDASSLA